MKARVSISDHDEDLAWRIEDACFKAWPALQESVMDGWLVRFARGLTRRANSANPLRSGRSDSDTLISAIENEYRNQQLPVFFRIPSIAGTAVSKRLAQRGYKTEGESLVLYADAGDVQADAHGEVTVAGGADAEWLDAVARLQGHSAERHAVYREIVDLIAVPAAFAALRLEGQIVSLAFGVVHDNLLCAESVVTDEAYRGQGLARGVLGTIITHARSNITGICLQVQADNGPGRRLYSRLGLRELYRYHYQGKSLEA